ncbi:MAG: transcription antitermination factor NusB [Acidobacteria bacterium]|nr:transcription antitermination factor NusB [Acidobacteriota bacterium]
MGGCTSGSIDGKAFPAVSAERFGENGVSNAGRSSRESRHFGREAAIQLLYQREVGELAGSSVDEAESSYWIERPVAENRRRFAHILLQGTLDTLDRIDPLIEAAADNWRISRMAVIDRIVLRVAVYELLLDEVPVAVVIDEAVELAKTFGDDQSPRFVNGVLDAIKRKLELT